MPTAPKFDLERAREEYRQGRSLRDVAKDMGCSHVHLWRLLMQSGEPIRSRSAPEYTEKMVRTRQQVTALKAAHAVLLYTHGVPSEEIACSMNHRIEWVHAKLKEAGIPPKDKP